MTNADLPAGLSAAVEHDVARRLSAASGAVRPSIAAARVLALILQLQPGVPFLGLKPEHLTGAAVAKHLGIPEATLNSVLNSYVARGWLSKRIGSVPGRVARRPSVVTLTFYDPSDALRALIEPLLGRR